MSNNLYRRTQAVEAHRVPSYSLDGELSVNEFRQRLMDLMAWYASALDRNIEYLLDDQRHPDGWTIMHAGRGAIIARPGEWVVRERPGRVDIYNDEQFQEQFSTGAVLVLPDPDEVSIEEYERPGIKIGEATVSFDVVAALVQSGKEAPDGK